jgi:hypothetical protein
MSRQPPLGLDFVVRHRRNSPLGWSLLVAGTVLVAAAILAWWLASAEVSHWREESLHWQNMAKRAGFGSNVTDGQVAAMQPEIDAAAKAVERLAIPWGELYGNLESTVDETISLLAVLPNAEKGEVRLNGEAKDFAALRAYLKRLSETGAFSDVRLLRQEESQKDPQRPIVFSISAAWRTAT